MYSTLFQPRLFYLMIVQQYSICRLKIIALKIHFMDNFSIQYVYYIRTYTLERSKAKSIKKFHYDGWLAVRCGNISKLHINMVACGALCVSLYICKVQKFHRWCVVRLWHRIICFTCCFSSSCNEHENKKKKQIDIKNTELWQCFFLSQNILFNSDFVLRKLQQTIQTI